MRYLSFEQISVAVIEKRPRNFFDLADSYQRGSIELQNTHVLLSFLSAKIIRKVSTHRLRG